MGGQFVIVSEIEGDRGADGSRVEASVVWEESERPPTHLFFEVAGEGMATLEPEPDALLVATLLSAWRHGERRLRVEGSLCPMLVQQVRAPLQTLASWYPDIGPTPLIECDRTEAKDRAGDRAISLLSNGIDSLATLRANRTWLPTDHPSSIRSCLLIDLVHHDAETDEYRPNPDAGKLEAAKRVAADVGADVTAVRTNLWWLDDDGWFFTKSSFAAMYLSAAHLLGASYSYAVIASGIDARHPFVPAGSSPLIDPYFSSSRLQVLHHGTYMTRLEKTALVADWPVGLDNIRVCVHEGRATGNCGTCEKCIRTMLTLEALGRLEASAAFERDDVDRDLLQTVIDFKMIWVSNLLDAYLELVPSLEQRGRHDLIEGIAAIAADFGHRAALGDGEIIEG